MTAWTQGEIESLRYARRDGRRVVEICRSFAPRHDRDEVIEAIDAVIRFDNNHEATRQVNWVLSMKAAGYQLVNSRVVVPVRPTPMFR